MKNYDLEMPILNKASKTPWRLRHAVTGVFIAGSTGSGKSSGSAESLALKYLRIGMGGLVLTSKPTDVSDWIKFAERANRSNDLVIIKPGSEYHFNFLQYISQKSETEKAITANIVNVLKHVIQAAKEKDSGVSNDPFWELSLDMVMTHTITLCMLAYSKVSVQLLYDLVQDLPRNGVKLQENGPFEKALDNAKEKVRRKTNYWFKTVPAAKLHQYKDSEDIYEDDLLENVEEARQFKIIHQFFFNIFLNVSDKTRSIIDLIFLGFLMPLLQEPAYSIFCHKPSNITPEDCLAGKIIVLSLPVKEYEKVGRDCQLLFKLLFEKSMEKRSIEENDRPVFLWQDEAQLFIMDHDTTFQATSRSSRVCSVLITQNLHNFYANMNGNNSESRVRSLISNLGTKIFHANSCHTTNTFSSELIGDADYIETSSGDTFSKEFSYSKNQREVRKRIHPPEHFISLKTGGRNNAYKIEAIMHVQGECLFGDRQQFNHSKFQFTQSI